MLKIAQVLSKEAGDAISEFQGNIEKIWQYYSDTNEIGKWSFQDVIVTDDTGSRIRIKIKDRVPVPTTAVAIYVKCGEDSKKQAKGVKLGISDKDEKRIEVSGWAEVLVAIGAEWKALDRIEKKTVEASPLPPLPGALNAETPQPPAPKINTPVPGTLENGNMPGPAYKGKENPGGPATIEPDRRTTKEKALALPVNQLIITKSACVKSAVELVSVLIQAGKIDLAAEPEKVKKAIVDAIDDYAGELYNRCFDLDEHIPF